jgi:hypothetical protein
MNRIKGILFITIISIAFISCVKETDEPKNGNNNTNPDTNFVGMYFAKQGTLRLAFNHTFGSSPLQLAPLTYVTAKMDTVAISDLKYYISHVKLIREDNSILNLQNNNLLDFITNKTEINLEVPAGKYKAVSFYLGVDSVNNSSGLQQGDLDPANGMFWTWSTGYIYYRLKARHGFDNKGIVYDIGGAQHLLSFTFDLSTYKVSKDIITVVINNNVAAVFNSPNQLVLDSVENQVHSATNPIIPVLKQNISSSITLKEVF